MKYSKKIETLRNGLWKEFKRRDETFEMTTLRSMIKELETGDYDKDKYSKENIEVMLEYMFTRYENDMIKWKEKIRFREKNPLWWAKEDLPF